MFIYIKFNVFCVFYVCMKVVIFVDKMYKLYKYVNIFFLMIVFIYSLYKKLKKVFYSNDKFIF